MCIAPRLFSEKQKPAYEVDSEAKISLEQTKSDLEGMVAHLNIKPEKTEE